MIGIVVVVILSLGALSYRMLARDVPEVEVTRAAAESSDISRGCYRLLATLLRITPLT